MNGPDQIFITISKKKRECGKMTHVWLCGLTEEGEKGREDKELFVLFNVVVYIILMNCM